MKKNNICFILALSCLTWGCENAVTFEAECDKNSEKAEICVDNLKYICVINSSTNKGVWEKQEDACNEKIIISTQCQEGDTKCSGGNIFTCTSEGNWPDEASRPCGEAGCSEGTIQPASNPLSCFECGSDEAKCKENDLVICSNHQLSKAACDKGCLQTETKAYCRECKDDELRCEDGKIIGCTKDGENTGKWDDAHKKQCEFGCFPGARGTADDVKCNECNTDESRCLDGTIQSCLSNKWHDIDKCEFGCTDGADAKCHECLNDNTKYYNHADGYCIEQKCENNQYQPPEPHEFSCNKELTGVGECLNGNAKCEDGTFKFCLDGSWNSFGNCDSENECSILNGKTCEAFSSVGQTCDNNKLKPCPNNASCKPDFSGCAECQSGTSKCQNNILKECKDGTYQETTCGVGTHCEIKGGKAQCIKHDCENGQQRCQDNTIQTCENYKWKTTAACANGEQCKVSGGIAACSCTSGTAYCDHTKAINCIDGQWQTTTCNITCSEVAGTAKCIECESGTKCQDETKIMTCQNNAWSAATSCADGMKCTGDTGSAKCVCTSGQAKCDTNNTKIIKCKADGTYGSAESCGANQHCEGVAGSAVCTDNPMECSPGEKRCNENDLQTCSSKGKWETQTCDKGCANMACNVCEEEEKKCEGNILKTCENGQWKTSSCALGCYDDTQCLVCPTGIKQCSGNKLRTCLGNKWEEEKCEAGCFTVNTNEATCNCIPGTVECVAPKNAKVCNQNSAWESKSCPSGCTNNVCKECNANAEKCEDGNHSTCSGNGEWIPDGCDYGCNEETGNCYPECTPDSKRCDHNSSITCNKEGQWPAEPTELCESGCNQATGECDNAHNCKKGASQCSDDIMKLCVNESWLSIPCLNGCKGNICKDLSKCIKNNNICQSLTNGTYILIPCNNGSLDFSSIAYCDFQCKKCDS